MMSPFDNLHLGGGRKLPLLLQTEAAECGLACLAMIASYYGYLTDIATLRQQYTVSLKGLNLVQLAQLAGKIQLSCRPLRVELEALSQITAPAILHWNLNHYVVLSSIRRGKFVIHDPAVGKQILDLTEVSKHFSGVAIEVEPTMQFRKRDERQSIRLRGLMGRVRGLKTSLVQVLILALTLEVFALLGPFLVQWVVDDALVSGDSDLLVVIIVGIVLIGLLQTIVTYFRSLVLIHLGASLNMQWVANVMEHLLKLPVPYFEKRHIGDVVSRFGSITAIQQTLTTSFVAAILDGLMAVITLIMMLIYSRPLAAVAIAAVVLYGALRIFRYGTLRAASEGQIVRLAKQQTYFLETIRGIQAIKLFNRHTDRKNRFLKIAIEATNKNIEIQRLNNGFQAVNSALIAVEGALILWLGSKSVLEGTFTIGMVMAFISYKDQFTGRISSLIDKGVEVKMLRLQAERLSDIVLATPEKEVPSAYRGTTELIPGIELKNVKFRYADGEPWVIDDLSMIISPGESVVLVGPSGCGKTSLLKIMLGQLKIQEGEILIGGIPLEQLGLVQYRDAIGVVMQNDRLFAGSLADNIAFFDHALDQQQIELCAKAACIHDDILHMSMGYNTLVGDMGTTLSGGQKQRILLARALYKRPKILFLDEATSHLDMDLEREIGQHIANLEITRIVIAHRPETIEASGRIIQLFEHKQRTFSSITNTGERHGAV